MKNTILLFALFITFLACTKKVNSTNDEYSSFKIKEAAPYKEVLFSIVKNQKFGFINVEGKEVIAPGFVKASAFSEGLSAVKMDDGKFGFIDSEGTLVIRPIFDFVEPFIFGLAKVFINQKGFFINKNGEKLIFPAYESYEVLAENRIKVQTKTEVFGLMDFSGKLIADTIYHALQIATANTFSVNKGGFPAVIDRNGKEILPYGNGGDADVFDVGVLRNIDWTDSKGRFVYFDEKGEKILPKHLEEKYDFQSVFKEGLAQVKMKISDHEYYAFVNEKGDLVINNKTFTNAFDFCQGRAFVQINNRKYAMIDKKGNFIGPKRYSDVGYTYNKSGFTLVHFGDENNWSLIDSNGVVLFLSNIQDYHFESIEEDLMCFTIANKKTYVNQKAKIVYQQSDDDAIVDLNFDYFRDARYHTIMSKKIAPNELQKLQIVAAPNEFAIFKKSSNGFKVYVTNFTSDSLTFVAQDGALNMAMEAQNEKGEWKSIEYLEPSWCGNSYQELTLAPSYQWAFVAPKYTGSFKTKLRFYLTKASVGLALEQTLEPKYYSNEFEGRINLTQFWKKEQE